MTGAQKIDLLAIAVCCIAESRKTIEEICGAHYLAQRENTEQQ